MRIKVQRRDYYLIVLIILILQSGLRYLSGSNLIDDVCVILCILAIFKNYGYFKNIYRIFEPIILTVVFLIVLGLLSSFASGIQSLSITIMDMYISFRFIIALFCGAMLALKSGNVDNKLYSISKVLIYAVFGLTFINTFLIEVFPTYQTRIIPCQQLFFENPAEMATVAIVCMTLQILSLRNKSNSIFSTLILGSFIVVSTVRLKAIAAVAVLWIIYLFFVKKILKNKAIFYTITIIATSLVGRDTFENYYLNLNQPRAILLLKSLYIAKDFFPLGAGFGTFGSFASRINYSSLYGKYGISGIYGLSAETGAYITDQMWATVFAQYGFVGFILFVVMFINFFKLSRRYIINDVYSFSAYLFMIIYLMMLSLAESALFNPSELTIFFIIGYILMSSKIRSKKSDAN